MTLSSQLPFTEEDSWAELEERLGIGAPLYCVNGVGCHSYEEACLVAGCDTPAQLADEAEYLAQLAAIQGLREPPYLGCCRSVALDDPDPSECPF